MWIATCHRTIPIRASSSASPRAMGSASHARRVNFRTRGLAAWRRVRPNQAVALARADITVYRDKDKIYKRYGPTYTGDFGIHNHQGYDYPRNDEGRSSAGCLVGRLNDGHRDFMRLVQTDKRFMANNGYHFMVTVMPASDVVATA